MNTTVTSARQSGRTTRTILNAPQNAIMVWPREEVGYARSLARFLNREDIEIVGPSFIENQRYRAGNRPVVFDHAYFEFNQKRHIEAFNYLEAQGRLR